MEIQKETVVALIPARSGSKGVPDKNIKLLAGRPLLAYSIVASLKAANIDRVIVSTDSQEYADLAVSYGAEVPFFRPAEISGDTSTDYEFVKHAIGWFAEHGGVVPEFIAHMRPTTPLREIHHIEKAIEMIKSNLESTALRSVHEMPESAYKTFEIHDDQLRSVGSGDFDLESANAPRQQFPKTYAGNGYVDILKSEYVIEHGKIHGNKVLAYVTPLVGEVDTFDDFKYLEYQVKENPALLKSLFD